MAIKGSIAVLTVTALSISGGGGGEEVPSEYEHDCTIGSIIS